MSQPAQYSHSYFIYPRFSMFSSFPKKTKNKPPQNSVLSTLKSGETHPLLS